MRRVVARLEAADLAKRVGLDDSKLRENADRLAPAHLEGHATWGAR